MILMNQDLIRSMLDYKDASFLIEEGFQKLKIGKLHNSNRVIFELSESQPILGAMAASDEDYVSAKVAAVNFDNCVNGFDAHQGAVLLYEKPRGQLVSVADASELTAIRTTAMSCLVVRLLRERIKTPKKIAIMGAGVQAFHHIQMFTRVYGVCDFVVVSRSKDRVDELARALSKDLDIEHRHYGKSVQDCELIVVATHGNDTVLTRDQVAPEATIFAIGACRSKSQEIDSSILDSCFFVADNKSACAQSSGEGQYIAQSESTPMFDILDLLNGQVTAPLSGVLVFKSVGLSFQDLVCAKYLYERSKRDMLGIHDPHFGGKRAY